MLKKSKKNIPTWWKDEPKMDASLYAFYCRRMRDENAEEWKDKPMTEQSKELAAAWKNVNQEQKEKIKKAFEKVKLCST